MPRRKKASNAQRLLLNVADVATMLGVCEATVYNLMYREGLPSVKIGSMRRFYQDALETWLKNHEVA